MKHSFILSVFSFSILFFTSSINALSYNYGVNFSNAFVSGYDNGVYRKLSGNTTLSAKHYLYANSNTFPAPITRKLSVELKYLCGIGNVFTCVQESAKSLGSVTIGTHQRQGPSTSKTVRWSKLPKRDKYYFVVYQTNYGALGLNTIGSGTVSTQ